MAKFDIENLPVTELYLVDSIDAITVGQSVTVEWREGDPGVFRQIDNDPANDVFLDEIPLTLSARFGATKLEGAYLTNGSTDFTPGAPGDFPRQATYTLAIRGILNTSKANPPTSSFSRNYKTHAQQSLCVCGETWIIRALQATLEDTKVDVENQSNLLAMGLMSRVNQVESDIEVTQDAFETSINNQQTAFEAAINSDFDNFTATQRDITVIVNALNTAQIDISSGNWLDSGVERAYAGVNASAVTLSQTTFYELVSGTGVLSTNTSGFTSGAYPIAKVITDGSAVTSVVNYGASYNVPAAAEGFDWTAVTSFAYTAGLLTSFIDADSVTWTLTYSGGELVSMTDGTDTTTITRDASGLITNIT